MTLPAAISAPEGSVLFPDNLTEPHLRVVHDLKSLIRFLWNLGFFYSSVRSDVPPKRRAWDQRPEGHVLFCPVTGGFRPSPGGSPLPAQLALTPAWRVSGAGLSGGSSLVERGEVSGCRLCDWLTEDGPKSCWRFLLPDTAGFEREAREARD